MSCPFVVQKMAANISFIYYNKLKKNCVLTGKEFVVILVLYNTHIRRINESNRKFNLFFLKN